MARAIEVPVVVKKGSLSRSIEGEAAAATRRLGGSSRSLQPLGRMMGKIRADADEFTKSIEASNARVIAFGASVAVINGISRAFKELIATTVRVEKTLTDINVVLNTSQANLQKFGDGIFKVAKNTAQSFEVAAEAALEFSRQGLSTTETLKRVNDALILTRLTGLKASESVKGLTAAVNGFGKAGLTTTQIINKLSAVDVKFAVGTDDLIAALSRAGAVAQDAGVSFDELVAMVTVAQQRTARGGAVIGNAFKTIYTRMQDPRALNALREVNIAVDDISGAALPANRVLQNLAQTYDTLTRTQKASLDQFVAGKFQINILKAALGDLSKTNNDYTRAQQVSANATDQAIQKNKQLNQTASALASQAGVAVEELVKKIGDISVGPGIKNLLTTINSLIEGMTKGLEGDTMGATFARGLLKGIGGVLTGPGLIVIGGVFIKLFKDLVVFGTKSLKNLLGLNNAAKQQAAIQQGIGQLLAKNVAYEQAMAAASGNVAKQQAITNSFLMQEVKLRQKAAGASAVLAAGAYRSGLRVGAGGTMRRKGIPGFAPTNGAVPNFAFMTIGKLMSRLGTAKGAVGEGKGGLMTSVIGTGAELGVVGATGRGPKIYDASMFSKKGVKETLGADLPQGDVKASLIGGASGFQWTKKGRERQDGTRPIVIGQGARFLRQGATSITPFTGFRDAGKLSGALKTGAYNYMPSGVKDKLERIMAGKKLGFGGSSAAEKEALFGGAGGVSAQIREALGARGRSATPARAIASAFDMDRFLLEYFKNMGKSMGVKGVVKGRKIDSDQAEAILGHASYKASGEMSRQAAADAMNKVLPASQRRHERWIGKGYMPFMAPNFSPLSDAISREKNQVGMLMGISPSSVQTRVVQNAALRSSFNPQGFGVISPTVGQNTFADAAKMHRGENLKTANLPSFGPVEDRILKETLLRMKLGREFQAAGGSSSAMTSKQISAMIESVYKGKAPADLARLKSSELWARKSGFRRFGAGLPLGGDPTRPYSATPTKPVPVYIVEEKASVTEKRAVIEEKVKERRPSTWREKIMGRREGLHVGGVRGYVARTRLGQTGLAKFGRGLKGVGGGLAGPAMTAAFMYPMVEPFLPQGPTDVERLGMTPEERKAKVKGLRSGIGAGVGLLGSKAAFRAAMALPIPHPAIKLGVAAAAAAAPPVAGYFAGPAVGEAFLGDAEIKPEQYGSISETLGQKARADQERINEFQGKFTEYLSQVPKSQGQKDAARDLMKIASAVSDTKTRESLKGMLKGGAGGVSSSAGIKSKFSGIRTSAGERAMAPVHFTRLAAITARGGKREKGAKFTQKEEDEMQAAMLAMDDSTFNSLVQAWGADLRPTFASGPHAGKERGATIDPKDRTGYYRSQGLSPATAQIVLQKKFGTAAGGVTEPLKDILEKPALRAGVARAMQKADTERTQMAAAQITATTGPASEMAGKAAYDKYLEGLMDRIRTNRLQGLGNRAAMAKTEYAGGFGTTVRERVGFSGRTIARRRRDLAVDQIGTGLSQDLSDIANQGKLELHDAMGEAGIAVGGAKLAEFFEMMGDRGNPEDMIKLATALRKKGRLGGTGYIKMAENMGMDLGTKGGDWGPGYFMEGAEQASSTGAAKTMAEWLEKQAAAIEPLRKNAEAAEEMQDEMLRLANILDKHGTVIVGIETFRNELGTAFHDFAMNAKSGSEALKDFGFNLLAAINKKIMQDFADRITEKLFGGVMDRILSSGKQHGGIIGAQNGMYISTGAPSGDSVPAMLEKGEYVLNRKLTAQIGRKNLDSANFGMVPRLTGGSIGMQTGGVSPFDTASPSVKKELSERFGPGILGTGYAAHAYAKDPQFIRARKLAEEKAAEAAQEKFAKQAKTDAMWKMAATAALTVGISKGMQAVSGSKLTPEQKAMKQEMGSEEFKKVFPDLTLSSRLKTGWKNAWGIKGGSGPDNTLDFGSGDIGDSGELSALHISGERPSWWQRFFGKHGTWGKQAWVDAFDGLRKDKQVGGHIDNIPAMLTAGEYVVGRNAVQKYGTGFLGNINRMQHGGPVGGGAFVQGEGATGGSTAPTTNNNNVSISVNFAKDGGAEVKSVEDSASDDPRKFAGKIREAVMNVINEEKRVGGSLRNRGRRGG